MTFNQITMKMFKANFRRYLLYFLCSSFTIMIFFIYATIFTNKNFMNSPKINSSISSMIIAPSMVITLFSIFFIIYSHGSFNKFRKPEFGMLLVLGMTDNDIRKIILIENTIIAVASLVAGLVSGSIISKLVYYVIIKIIGIKGVFFTLTLNSYLCTIALFTLIYLVVIVISMVTSLRYEIVTLLKELRREDKGGAINHIFAFVGIIIIICSVIDMVKNYNMQNSSVLLRSLLLCFTGTYLLMSNLVGIFERLSNFSKKMYCKNMLFNSNLKYTFGRSKNVLFVITCLVSITILFSSLSVVLISKSETIAVAYNPFDIAYTESFEMNQIHDNSLDCIIKHGETPLTLSENLEFIEQPHVAIFSDDQLNKISGSNIHVKDKHFISLFQIVKNDGYDYELSQMKYLNINLNNKIDTYIPQGKYVKVLFNRLNILSGGFCVILNNNDYLQIKKNINANEIGHISLFNFEDWEKTGGIADKLSEELEKNNEGDMGSAVINSKIKDYTDSKQGNSFLVFLLIFVSLLFFLASNVMLHFKFLTEFEREKLKYKKIYKIGITKQEVTKIISKELKVLFLLPVIFGIIISTSYSYYINLQYGRGIIAAQSSLVIGLTYICLQVISYFVYKKHYINKLFDF